MLGVSNNPFSPFNRSSLVESRHGLQWLATKCAGFSTPVILHLDSIRPTRSLNSPCPILARTIANRSVSGIEVSSVTPCSNFRSQESRSSVDIGLTFAAIIATGLISWPIRPISTSDNAVGTSVRYTDWRPFPFGWSGEYLSGSSGLRMPMCSLGRTLLASSTKWTFTRQPIPSQFSPDFPNSKGLGLSQQYD